jgi:hypothetical protein
MRPAKPGCQRAEHGDGQKGDFELGQHLASPVTGARSPPLQEIASRAISFAGHGKVFEGREMDGRDLTTERAARHGRITISSIHGISLAWFESSPCHELQFMRFVAQ